MTRTLTMIVLWESPLLASLQEEQEKARVRKRVRRKAAESVLPKEATETKAMWARRVKKMAVRQEAKTKVRQGVQTEARIEAQIEARLNFQVAHRRLFRKSANRNFSIRQACSIRWYSNMISRQRKSISHPYTDSTSTRNTRTRLV